MKTLILAHYYTTPDVQAMADYVGDSLDLALIAQREKADRIVFAGVKFMAETAKMLNSNAEVILPDADSTCSLVTQTDLRDLTHWREKYPEHVHVSYINSSAQHKALSDWIVTSRNVNDIIASIYAEGKKVIFSPDRNMGAYLNETYDYDMPLWSAVCEVHDDFSEKALDIQMQRSTDGPKYILAHPESPLPVLKRADLVGSTKQMLDWVTHFKGSIGTIIVATEEGLLFNMRESRPDQDIQLAPTYSGCQCNSCPYMKKNTVELVKNAAEKGEGLIIDYLSDNDIKKGLVPVQRMLDF